MRIPKVSVCIDVFNYAAFLPEAIESVLAQDFSDFELIIGDDCSQDSSFEIARAYAAKDERIVARQNPANLGMVKNRNACLRSACGEYVKILHADDWLCSKSALGKMAAALDGNPGMSLVACAMQVVDPLLKKLRRRSYFDGQSAVAGTAVITRCLRDRRNLIGSPSAAMFRRERGLRGFDEAFFNSADWEMWLHLLEQGCFGYISEPLVAYREHAGQQTGKDRHTLTESRDQLGILDRYLDRPYVRLAKLCKRYLRHRAIADLVNRGRQLGHPEEKVLAGKGTLFAPLSPVLFGYRHYLQTRRFMESALRRCQRQNAGKRMDQFSPGLNVAGFFKGEYGVGDTSRTFLKVIRESRLPAVFININSRNHRNLDRSFDCFSRKNPHSVNLMTFSFDYARRFYRDRGKRYFKHRYNIGIWFCELENLAPRWHHCFDYYDEIWVTTRFCQKSLAAVSPIPVTRINYPFYPGEAPAPDRDGFGFDRDAFLFLFNFDFHSVVERKNPAGLIAAFSKAFGGGKENAVLILKSINARHYPALAAELQRVTANLNVRWINEHLDGPRMKQLFATADCYVSLHRSEGLGLGMARAMSFGKPVIATGYSGNLDFTTPENSLLVRYELAEITSDHGMYEKGNVWAEPDTDHAAEQMRWVFENPAQAGELGRLGKTHLQRTMDPATSLGQISKRLGEIDARFKSL